MVDVILADDHPIVLMGVRSLLAHGESGIRVVGEANSGAELFAMLADRRCDLLITDFSMPAERRSEDGLPMLGRLHRLYPALPIVVLTMVHNQALVRGMFSSGARGVVAKRALTRELASAVRAVMDGQIYVSEDLRAEVAAVAPGEPERGGESVSGEHVLACLSPREAEVVRLYVEGLSVTQIAERLHRSVKTVSQQKNDAMRKLGLSSNGQLYELARNSGVLD